MKNMLLKISVSLSLVALFSGLAAAAGGEHHADSGVLLKDFLWRCLNFAITFGLLAYFVTKPIRNGLAGRSEGIAQALEEARKAKSEAEAKFAEYDRKLSKASEEIEGIYQDIRKEGELERDRIVADAKEMALKIQKDAENTASLEVSRARAVLRQEAAHLAIEIAEELLKKGFTSEDQSRLVDEYLQKVGELH